MAFLTRGTFADPAESAGYRVVRIRPACFFPFPLAGIGHFINWIMPLVPFFRWLGFAWIAVIHPVMK